MSEKLLTSRGARAVGIGALFLLGAGLAILLLHGGSRSASAPAPARPAMDPAERGGLAVSYLLVRPVGAHFGETVTADAQLVLRNVDPQRIRIEPRFAPYGVVTSSREQRGSGGRTLLHLHWSLQCLSVRCLARNDRDRVFRFGLSASAPGLAPLRKEFPRLLVTSRLALQGTSLQSGVLVEDNASAAPSSLGLTVSSVVAAGLLGAGLLVLAAPRRRLRAAPQPASEPADPDAALREAIGRVDEVVVAVSWERRRGALDHLARTVEGLDPDLADELRELAWREAEPDDAAVEQLLERARELLR